METEQFIQHCEDIKNANPSGASGDTKTYFTAIYLGFNYPELNPPVRDPTAVDGYELGKRLSKKLK